MELSAPGLENAIVRFEPLDETHRADIFASDVEASVWKWMPALPGGTNLANYFEFLLREQKKGRAATFVLKLQSSDAFAGITAFNQINKIHRRLRNALVWHPPHLATPQLFLAGQLLMIERAYAWRAKRLEWQVNPDNHYVMTGLAEIAPTREARFRNYERTAEGLWVDKVVFSMTRTEMADAIKRLSQSVPA